MLLFSSLIKKLFSMEHSRTQSAAIQRNHTHSQESDSLLKNPRAGAIPSWAKQQLQVLSRSAKTGHCSGFGGQPNILFLFAQSGTYGAEGGHYWSMSKDGEAPRTVWHGLAASRNKSRFCSSQGPWPISVS